MWCILYPRLVADGSCRNFLNSFIEVNVIRRRIAPYTINVNGEWMEGMDDNLIPSDNNLHILRLYYDELVSCEVENP